MRFDLRTKLSLAFIAVVVLAVGVTLWQARRTMTELFSAEFELRIARADEALRGEYKALEEDLDAALAALGEGGGEAYNPLDHLLLDMRAGRLDPDRRRAFADYLPGLMRTAGLDLLSVLSDHGRVLGSGHLPGRVGDIDEEGLARALSHAGETFVTMEDIRAGKGIARRMTVQLAGRLERYDVAVIVVAGRVLDDELMARLASGPGMTVRLLSPDGEVIAAAGPDRPAGPSKTHELTNPDGTVAARLVIAVDDASLQASLQQATRAASLVAAVSAALALLVAFGLAFRITQPLRELAAAAGRLAGGDLERSEIPARTRDEVGDLVRAFNRMTADLLRSRDELRRAERVAAWREIARRIAHEIKNPLSPIRTSVETLRKAKAKEHPAFAEIFEESTSTVLEEVERLKRIVDEFSRFARLPAPRLERTRMEDVVASTVALYAPSAGTLEVRVEHDEGLPAVMADREQITQVLLNLLKNASEATKGDGTVTVALRSVDAGAGLEIHIHDDGPGIPPEAREKLFAPYFTTKSEGTGLGLAICQRIIGEHGGAIDLAQDAGPSGTTFVIRLPAAGGRD